MEIQASGVLPQRPGAYYDPYDSRNDSAWRAPYFITQTICRRQHIEAVKISPHILAGVGGVGLGVL
jgi:hypothetical protein